MSSQYHLNLEINLESNTEHPLKNLHYHLIYNTTSLENLQVSKIFKNDVHNMKEYIKIE